MRMQLQFFVIVAALVAGAGLVACSDDDASSSPLQPSPLATAPATPAAMRQASQAGAPAGAGSGLAPRSIDDFNAYDFEATWDGSMLSLALIEDEMRSMRQASKPHRNRRITVGTCPVEPHHALQACGAPLWEGTRRLAGRLELPPIPLPECDGWIIVNAAELSDDATDGWRNAPCPSPDGESVVGSDGTGEEWPEYPEREQGPTPQNIVDKALGGGLVTGGSSGYVDVSLLFQGTGDTTGRDYRATSSDPAVATVEVTSNPRVVITPVGPGTTTIGVTFLRTGARVEFDVTIAPEPAPPGPSWRSLGAADLHVLDRRTSGFVTPVGSRIELSSFTAQAIRGMPGHVLFEWRVSRGSLAPAPLTWRDCRLGIRFDDDGNDYNRYNLKAGWFETGVARPLPAPYGPTASVENPPFLDVWNAGDTVLLALADLRPDTLVNAAFVKRAGVTAPPDATMVRFDGYCNNYALMEDMDMSSPTFGQLVLAHGGSEHRSVYAHGARAPYPVMFPSP